MGDDLKPLAPGAVEVSPDASVEEKAVEKEKREVRAADERSADRRLEIQRRVREDTKRLNLRRAKAGGRARVKRGV